MDERHQDETMGSGRMSTRVAALALASATVLCGDPFRALAARPQPAPLRCQKTIVQQELDLLRREARATASCVVNLLGCELEPTDDPETCRLEKVAKCERDLDALAEKGTGRAAKIVKACGEPMPAAFLAGDVLGFEAVVSRCLGEGFPVNGTRDLEACLSAEVSRQGTTLALLPLPRACEILTQNGLVERFPGLTCGEAPPQGCPALGGNVSGVDFTDEQAHDVLDLVNNGTADDLDAISGIGPSLASTIVADRPFADLAELDAVGSVGASVLANLRDEVGALWCPTPRAACGCDA